MHAHEDSKSIQEAYSTGKGPTISCRSGPQNSFLSFGWMSLLAQILLTFVLFEILLAKASLTRTLHQADLQVRTPSASKDISSRTFTSTRLVAPTPARETNANKYDSVGLGEIHAGFKNSERDRSEAAKKRIMALGIGIGVLIAMVGITVILCCRRRYQKAKSAYLKARQIDGSSDGCEPPWELEGTKIRIELEDTGAKKLFIYSLLARAKGGKEPRVNRQAAHSVDGVAELAGTRCVRVKPNKGPERHEKVKPPAGGRKNGMGTFLSLISEQPEPDLEQRVAITAGDSEILRDTILSMPNSGETFGASGSRMKESSTYEWHRLLESGELERAEEVHGFDGSVGRSLTRHSI